MQWNRVVQGLRRATCLVALGCGALAAPASAGDTTVELPPTIIPNDAVDGVVTAWTDLGREMHTDGNWLALAASPVDSLLYYVFLYEWDGSSWIQRQELPFDESVILSQVHWESLALDGDTLSVLVDDDAHVYRLVQGTWSLEQILTPADAGGSSFFNQSLSGDTLVLADTGIAGPVQVFERSGSVWSHAATLPAGYYLSSVEIEDDTLFAATLSGGGTNVRMFERSGGTWAVTGPLPGLPNGSIESMVIEGDRAALSDFHATWGSKGGAGVVYAYERSGGVWTLTQTLTEGSPGVTDSFGRYMHMAGDTMAVRSDPANGDELHVFQHDGTQWNLVYEEPRLVQLCLVANDQVLVSTNTLGPEVVDVYEEQAGSWVPVGDIEAFLYQLGGDFGKAIAVSGSRMLVGAPQAGSQPPDTYVQPTGLTLSYSFDGTDWVLDEVLEAFDASSGDQFGAAVALDGDYAIIGAPGHPSTNGGRGVIYAYRHDGVQWQLEALIDDFGVTGFGFGRALDMDFPRLVVGAPDAGGAGSAFTFQRNAQTDTWDPRTSLVSPQSSIGDRFGFAVAVDRSHLAVSARASLVATYLDTPSGWTAEDVLFPPNGPGGWGWDLDIDVDHLVVGAPYATPAELSGMIAVYERLLDGTWVERDQLYHPFSVNPREHLGFAVSMQGDLILGTIDSEYNGAQPSVDLGFWIFQREGAGWSSQALQDVPLFPTSGSLVDSQVVVADRDDPGAIQIFDLDHQPASFCWGDGNEGACPCGNVAGAGQGCATSTGAGAVLDNTGTTSLAADDLVVNATQLPLNKPGIFFAGTQPVSAPLGDGLLCVVPQYRGLPQFSGAGGTFGQASLGTTLGASPGDAWYVQTWFRDPAGPCGSGFGTSNGLIVTFTP